MIENKDSFWIGKWSWLHAMTVILPLVGMAYVIQFLHPSLSWGLPGAPWNWIIVFCPLMFLGLLMRLFPQNSFLRGLSGLPMGLLALFVLAFVSLPGAVLPQGDKSFLWQKCLGLGNVFQSLPFVTAYTILMVHLALSCFKRFQKSRLFFFVHVGLLIVLCASAAGSGSLQRIQLVLLETADFVSAGYHNNKRIDLPFSIQLQRFHLESYPPKLSLAKSHGQHQEQEEHKHWSVSIGKYFLEPGITEIFDDYEITVNKVLPKAYVENGLPKPIDHKGALPAAHVSVKYKGQPIGQGWLHPTSPFGEHLFVELNKGEILMLQKPRPKIFESLVNVKTGKDAAVEQKTIRVNQPLKSNGWSIYQYSYDEYMGGASTRSVLELVRDPALPFVYTGVFMFLFGVLLYLWKAADVLKG